MMEIFTWFTMTSGRKQFDVLTNRCDCWGGRDVSRPYQCGLEIEKTASNVGWAV